MRLPFCKPKEKDEAGEQARRIVSRRLSRIRRGEKLEAVSKDTEELVGGLAHGDG